MTEFQVSFCCLKMVTRLNNYFTPLTAIVQISPQFYRSKSTRITGRKKKMQCQLNKNKMETLTEFAMVFAFRQNVAKYLVSSKNCSIQESK